MYLITSKTDRKSLELAKNAASFLRENGIKFGLSRVISIAGKKELSGDYGLIIAIGDNKFILETFRRLGKIQIPVFAIASTQSFLAQANSLNFKHYLNLIKKGKYEIFKRSRLAAKFEKTTTPIGLNDICLF